MDDSDLSLNSPHSGTGEPTVQGMKRKQPNLASERGDNAERPFACGNHESLAIKKARVDDNSNQELKVTGSTLSAKGHHLINGYHLTAEGQSSSEMEDEGTLNCEHGGTKGLKENHDQLLSQNNHCDLNCNVKQSGYDNLDGDKPNSDGTTEALSPTLETSYDFLDSPDSPDWLQEGYFEKRVHEHSSQKSKCTQELTGEVPEVEQVQNENESTEDMLDDTVNEPNEPELIHGCSGDKSAEVFTEGKTQNLKDSISKSETTTASNDLNDKPLMIECDSNSYGSRVIITDNSEVSQKEIHVSQTDHAVEASSSKTISHEQAGCTIDLTDETDTAVSEEHIKISGSMPSVVDLTQQTDTPEGKSCKGPEQCSVIVVPDRKETIPLKKVSSKDTPRTSFSNNALIISGNLETDHFQNKGVSANGSRESTGIIISDEDIIYVSDDAKPSNSSHFNDDVTRNIKSDRVSAVYDTVDGGNISSQDTVINDELEVGVVEVTISNTENVDKPGGASSAQASLSQTDSIEQDANTIANIMGDVDVELVMKRLKQKRAEANRVDMVLNEVLEGQLKNAVQKTDAGMNSQLRIIMTSDATDDPLMADVQAVVKQVPGADPKTAFHMLLESTSSPADRVETVVAQLKGKPGTVDPNVILENDGPSQTSAQPPNIPALKSTPSDPAHPLVAGDELYNDMRTIAKIIPDKDQNEIYAYLEAHHDRPNRVQLVLNELLSIGGESQTPPVNHHVDLATDLSINRSVNEATPKEPSTNPISDLQKQVDHLRIVFPDCDPNYLFHRLEQWKDVPDRTQRLAAEMFERKNYPKLKDTLEKNAKEEKKNKLMNMELNMTEFLTMFPDPDNVFLNEEKPVNEAYKEHALTQLVNYFPRLKEQFIKKILVKKKNHFTPALRELEREAEKYTDRHKNSSKYLKQARQIEKHFPEQPDEFFFKELLFSKHQEAIQDYIKNQEQLRKTRLEEAKRDGSLMECGCCFDDECIFEDMAACADGHLFCKECVRRSAEVRIGENKFDFPCLGEGCEHQFQIQTLQSVLPHNVFSNVLRKKQEEEIKQADIPDLVSCPFCSFATIMPDPNDKVFKCLNPECLKESCRLCKEPNHVPLRCEEVEKGGETSMRTFIENRMTESMLRTCWRCKKKFFKLDGCNKMTCNCGATMCYVCREPNIDYEHFNGKTKCAAFTDMNELHIQEMEKAAKEAEEKYKAENPEASNLALKNDPKKLIEEMQREREREQATHMMGQGLAVFGGPGVRIVEGFVDNDDNGEESYSEEEDDGYGEDERGRWGEEEEEMSDEMEYW